MIRKSGIMSLSINLSQSAEETFDKTSCQVFPISIDIWSLDKSKRYMLVERGNTTLAIGEGQYPVVVDRVELEVIEFPGVLKGIIAAAAVFAPDRVAVAPNHVEDLLVGWGNIKLVELLWWMKTTYIGNAHFFENDRLISPGSAFVGRLVEPPILRQRKEYLKPINLLFTLVGLNLAPIGVVNWSLEFIKGLVDWIADDADEKKQAQLKCHIIFIFVCVHPHQTAKKLLAMYCTASFTFLNLSTSSSGNSISNSLSTSTITCELIQRLPPHKSCRLVRSHAKWSPE